MARFNTSVGLEDFIQDLSAIDVEYVAPHALEQSAPIVERRLKENASKHRRTGAMEKSIRSKKPTKKKGRFELFVGPQGTDKRGVRNMEKMAYLEYGVKKHKQSPTPVITPTVQECRDKVCNKMQETFDRYLNQLGL